MLTRVLPLLPLLLLTAGCITGATGEQGGHTTPETPVIIIETVTPVPTVEPASEEIAGAGPATPGATATETATPSTQTALLPAEASPEAALAEDTATIPPSETATASATPSPSQTPTVTETPTETPTPTPSPTPTPAVTPLPGLSVTETQIVHKHNEYRAGRNREPLEADSTLMAIAAERAETMAETGSLSHYNPDGTNVFDMMADYGYAYGVGAENVHYNYGVSPQESWQLAMTEYRASAGHYASIINPRFTQIGVGIATGADGSIYYAVVFSD